jgi:hypothetical protein
VLLDSPPDFREMVADENPVAILHKGNCAALLIAKCDERGRDMATAKGFY